MYRIAALRCRSPASRCDSSQSAPAFTRALILGLVSPTKVRKVPQDFCQQSGRKGFSAIPEHPRRDLLG